MLFLSQGRLLLHIGDCKYLKPNVMTYYLLYMTVKDLKSLIIECLKENDVPMGSKVGEIPPDVLKSRMVPSQPSKAIKLRGFKTEEPDPELQSKLDMIKQRYASHLSIDAIAYKDRIRLKGLNATEDAPKGTGSSYMQDLINLADSKGLLITLSLGYKGYGDMGFKKTSSTRRLTNFYRRFGFEDRNLKTDVSDDMFREPKLNEFNVKKDTYRYYGFTTNQEDEIANKLVKYHTLRSGLEKERIEQEFETLYQYVVGRNPVLKSINVYPSDYKGKLNPRMDLVFGVISGIPPEDIKDYIEFGKGAPALTLPRSSYSVDNYFKLIRP